MGWKVAGTTENTSKIAPLFSARPGLPKRLPPSVLGIRRDLRVFLWFWTLKNMQITTDSEHRGGTPVGQNGPVIAEGCDVCSFFSLPAIGRRVGLRMCCGSAGCIIIYSA